MELTSFVSGGKLFHVEGLLITYTVAVVDVINKITADMESSSYALFLNNLKVSQPVKVKYLLQKFPNVHYFTFEVNPGKNNSSCSVTSRK